MPADHTTVVDAQRGVGNDQPFVDADHTAKTLTLGTCPCWRVERKENIRRLFESDAVGLEALREIIADIRGQEHQPQFAVAFEEGGLCGIH